MAGPYSGSSDGRRSFQLSSELSQARSSKGKKKTRRRSPTWRDYLSWIPKDTENRIEDLEIKYLNVSEGLVIPYKQFSTWISNVDWEGNIWIVESPVGPWRTREVSRSVSVYMCVKIFTLCILSACRHSFVHGLFSCISMCLLVHIRVAFVDCVHRMHYKSSTYSLVKNGRPRGDYNKIV